VKDPDGSRNEYHVGAEISIGFCRESTEPVEEFWKNEREHWKVHGIMSLYKNFT